MKNRIIQRPAQVNGRVPFSSFQGKYLLAKQFGNAGFYADVVLKVRVESGHDDVVITYPADMAPDWQAAIGFGLAYAREHLPRDQRLGKRLSVEILSAKGHLVDTSTMTLAFAAAKALWNAMGCEGPPGFVLDAGTRAFHVPK